MSELLGLMDREEAKMQLIENLGKHFVLGSDPFRIESLWQKCIHAITIIGIQSRPLLLLVLSAIEMGLLGHFGKVLETPRLQLAPRYV
ncbi:MAG: hypothetical protein QXX08_02110 [Candidatus Bathyarchaeia archaeon]